MRRDSIQEHTFSKASSRHAMGQPQRLMLLLQITEESSFECIELVWGDPAILGTETFSSGPQSLFGDIVRESSGANSLHKYLVLASFQSRQAQRARAFGSCLKPWRPWIEYLPAPQSDQGGFQSEDKAVVGEGQNGLFTAEPGGVAPRSGQQGRDFRNDVSDCQDLGGADQQTNPRTGTKRWGALQVLVEHPGQRLLWRGPERPRPFPS